MVDGAGDARLPLALPIQELASDRLLYVGAGHSRGGAGFRSPIAGVAFTIGALSMVGFPFLGGFASKLNFALAAMDVGGARTMLVLITLAISTWLNTLYFLRTVITLYRKPVPGAVYSVARGQRGFCFNASLVAFSIVNVALGLFAQTFVSAITAGLATFG